MSLTSMLLAAQARPADEASRITSVITAAMTGEGSDDPGPALYETSARAIEAVNADIEREKRPASAAPSAAHLARFDESPDITFTDEPPASTRTVSRASTRYLLGDVGIGDSGDDFQVDPRELFGDESEPSGAAEIDMENDNTVMDHEMESEPIDRGRYSQPWISDHEIAERGGAVAEIDTEPGQLDGDSVPARTDDEQPKGPEHEEEPDDAAAAGPQPLSPIAGLPSAPPTDYRAFDPVTGEPDGAPDDADTGGLNGDDTGSESRDDTDDSGYSGDLTSGAAPDSGGEDPDAEQDPHGGENPAGLTAADPGGDEPESEQDAGNEPDSETDSEDDVAGSVESGPVFDAPPDLGDDDSVSAWESDIPSPTDGIAHTSPWNDEHDLTLPTDDGGVIHIPETKPDQGGETAPEPVRIATRPPGEHPEPATDPAPSIRDRVRDAINSSSTRDRIDQARAFFKTKLGIGIAIGVIVLIVGVIALSVMRGGRGEPPTPAGQIPQAAADTADAKPDDITLIPSEVSASCGTDSDPVAPFAGVKNRAWVCKRINGLDGNVLNIQFASDVIVNEIMIVPGYNYVAPDGRDEWGRHRLVSAVTWRLGGQFFYQKITPVRTGVSKSFPSVQVRQMSMTITASVRPPVDTNTADTGMSPEEIDATTAVSKIVIRGRLVDPGAKNGR